MRTTARKLALVGALTGVLVLGAACDREPTVQPTPSPTVEVEADGIDWEDCVNGEPDCFLNKRKTTVKPKTTTGTKPNVKSTGRGGISTGKKN